MPTLALCVGPTAQPPVNIYLPHCTSRSPLTLIVAVWRMLMVPPTGCVSTTTLPPTRHSLIVNRRAAATVRSLFSDSHEVFVPPGPMRLIPYGRLMMALRNVQQGEPTPSQQDWRNQPSQNSVAILKGSCSENLIGQFLEGLAQMMLLRWNEPLGFCSTFYITSWAGNHSNLTGGERLAYFASSVQLKLWVFLTK